MSDLMPERGHTPLPVELLAVQQAYDGAGAAYGRYADGDVADCLAFDGPHAEADRRVWSRIDDHLVRCRESGRRDLRVLDVGCGPGTWLARVVARTAALGFETVELVGLDLAPGMIETARTRLENAAQFHRGGRTRVFVHVESGDAATLLPSHHRRFDLTLCLYSVLNHLAGSARQVVAAELARLTAGRLFVSVRAAGSLPTIYIDRLDQARDFRQDGSNDRLSVDLLDGRHLTIPSHLFRATELDTLFEPHLATRSIVGLDLFHARFAGDPRWTGGTIEHEAFLDRLKVLERIHEADPDLIDHATHLLLIGEGRSRADRR